MTIMNSTHDILRARLLFKAGIFKTPKGVFKTLSEIYQEQWNHEFEQKMRNRLAMGYFRYGPLKDQIGRHPYDNVKSIEERLQAYIKTHNREHLVDIANLALVEFTVHPEFPFKSSDDGIHTPKKG